VMTFAAASRDTGNNWAKQVGAAAIISSAQTNPWMPLSRIKLTRILDDSTLKYYVTANPSLNKPVYHQKCLARRDPIGFFMTKLYRFKPFQGKALAERIQ
jgi:hypothetical protein